MQIHWRGTKRRMRFLWPRLFVLTVAKIQRNCFAQGKNRIYGKICGTFMEIRVFFNMNCQKYATNLSEIMIHGNSWLFLVIRVLFQTRTKFRHSLFAEMMVSKKSSYMPCNKKMSIFASRKSRDGNPVTENP